MQQPLNTDSSFIFTRRLAAEPTKLLCTTKLGECCTINNNHAKWKALLH